MTSDERPRLVAAAALVIVVLLGMAGSFALSAPIPGLAWSADATALVMASALLAAGTAGSSWR